MQTAASPSSLARRPARTNRRLIGEILVSQGIISPEQLQEVLALQKTDRRSRLGRLLIDLGYVTETQLAELVADQLRLPCVRVGDLQLRPEVLRVLPKELAVKHTCVPWKLEGKQLTLVTSDPTNVSSFDSIGFAIGYAVKVAVAAESEVAAAVAKYYGLPADAEAPLLSLDQIDIEDQLSVVDDAEAEVAADDIARAAQAAPVITLVNGIVADAIKARASDIHIEPQEKGVALRYRVDGALRHILTIPKRAQAKIVSRIKIMAHLDIAERRKPQDGRSRVQIAGKTYDLRVSTLPTVDGEKLVIRILVQDRAQVALDELGFEPSTLETFRELLSRPQGLVLVTGPTGSGKTTTLYASLNHLLKETTNIVTVEDPVEYRVSGVNQVAVNEKAGLSFAAGLRSILRQDPDIVMVGEIRDAETARIAFQAAQTGHLVFSTLHTNDAPSAVTRLVDMGIPAYIVAASVIGVQAQRLVRKLCECKRTLPDGTAQPVGCPECRGTGFRGRVAVYELMPVTPEVRRALFTRASDDDIRAAARASGMRTLFEDGVIKVSHAVTTIEEVRKIAPPPEVYEPAPAVPLVVAASPAPERPSRPTIVPAVPAPAVAPVHAATLPAPAVTAPTMSARGRSPLVLMAEADRELIEGMLMQLGHVGIDLLTAGGSAELVQMAARHAPDVVVIEHGRHQNGRNDSARHENGLEVVRRLRGDARTANACLVVLSHDGTADDEIALLDAGADDVRRPPVTAPVLTSVICRRLSRRAPSAA
ncbi:MAG: ATPase, T2SS/T4P/T4SS family [Vicinamibacterales bacterium]